MHSIRLAWLVFFLVVLVVAASAPLRDQVVWPLHHAVWETPFSEYVGEGETPADTYLKPFRARAIQSAKAAPMSLPIQIGAGFLARDTRVGLAHLRKTAEDTGESVAWAAYVLRLVRAGPEYSRLGTQGVDPADPQSVANGEEKVRDSRLPQRLAEAAVAPLLQALHGWEAAEPKNGLPLAVEAYYLYGLHRDQEALARWQAASKRPTAYGYSQEIDIGIADCLALAGVPKPDAWWLTIGCVGPGYTLLSRTRDFTRAADYEGRIAAMRGDAKQAIAWWAPAIEIGQHIQESAHSTLEYVGGGGIQSVGASPVWRWRDDRTSGIPDGPLMKGRLFYGRYHDLYSAHMGEAAVAALRDRLVLGKLRQKVEHGYVADVLLESPYMFATTLLVFAAVLGWLLWWFLLEFLISGTWRRRQADEATTLSQRAAVLMALLIVLPVAIPALVMAAAAPSSNDPREATLWGVSMAGMLTCFLAFVFGPLVAARYTHKPFCHWRTAWRGIIRRVVPIAIALVSLALLVMLVLGAQYRAEWVRQCSDTTHHEMAGMIEALGPSWTRPTIPPDSWRAEYPPKK